MRCVHSDPQGRPAEDDGASLRSSRDIRSHDIPRLTNERKPLRVERMRLFGDRERLSVERERLLVETKEL
jgi:hypothetical protein